MAAKLSWEGGEDVYGAGKRDVATLYEYWVFIKLAELVSNLCDTPFDFTDFIESKNNALNVTLKTGIQKVLKGSVERKGRSLSIELWFNRSFRKQIIGDGSWSQTMRPDYSLKISPSVYEIADFEPVFLHFDAKYRISDLVEIFGSTDNEEEPSESENAETKAKALGPKRDDILKMHAYRDAIRRSAGAYVVYPGSQTREYREYKELLPGLDVYKRQHVC